MFEVGLHHPLQTHPMLGVLSNMHKWIKVSIPKSILGANLHHFLDVRQQDLLANTVVIMEHAVEMLKILFSLHLLFAHHLGIEDRIKINFFLGNFLFIVIFHRQ